MGFGCDIGPACVAHSSWTLILMAHTPPIAFCILVQQRFALQVGETPELDRGFLTASSFFYE